ncbi:transporter substrate-binding domain-containing protein [Caballeronia sp. LZ025]|uniref:transporter substrate-binding domain-containing protein n=1 Tax=Caballeronia TaxID=1827195 RepID=UPI001FD6091D|nr:MULTISPECIES: transporter substrate-binding domain-containing protein [Caballeronia]MDR5733936.1 transporter substrate-binding domain-containing protein [Caballeronia sp. LZ025]
MALAAGCATANAETSASAAALACPGPGYEATLKRALAQGSTLHASINIGNPVLARINRSSGKPEGVSVDMATALARRLDLTLELVPVTSASAAVNDVDSGKTDVGFFAIDPSRRQSISFTSPYLLIEGAYAVRAGSPVSSLAQVDQPGVTVAVSKGSAYDLFLSRALHHASIIRVAPSSAVFPAFIKQHLDVLAGIRPQLVEQAAQQGGALRVLEPPFMVIRQAMGMSKRKGDEASACLARFVDDMRSSGFVAKALVEHDVAGGSVAPSPY